MRLSCPHIKSNIPVPKGTFYPVMILCETPFNESYFPYMAASNNISIVFSKEANIKVEFFSLSTPNLVNPNMRPNYEI